jgi:two-component sensor histidine kinase
MKLLDENSLPKLIKIELIFKYIQEPAFIFNREGILIDCNENGYEVINPSRNPDYNPEILNISPTLRNLTEWRQLLAASENTSTEINLRLNGFPTEATLISTGKGVSVIGLIILPSTKPKLLDAGKEAIRIAENIRKNMLGKRKEDIQESLMKTGEYFHANKLSVLQLNLSQNQNKVVFDQIFTWSQNQDIYPPTVDNIEFNLEDQSLNKAFLKLNSGNMAEIPGFISDSRKSSLSGKTLMIPILIENQFQGALSAEINTENLTLSEEEFFLLKLLSCAVSLWMDRTQEVSQQITWVKEKETLLSGLQHRFKNNLAILSGFLDLFDEYNRPATTKELTLYVRERIQALALVYEATSNSSGLTKLALQKYLELLAFRIESSYCQNGEVTKIIHAENILLCDINQMITVGLLLNEIFLNAYQHGLKFSADPQLNVQVKLIEDILEIHIQDNGPGLPENWDENSLPDTLGFTIIKGLSKQLKSSFEVNSSNGCSFLLKFKNLIIEKH